MSFLFIIFTSARYNIPECVLVKVIEISHGNLDCVLLWVEIIQQECLVFDISSGANQFSQPQILGQT